MKFSLSLIFELYLLFCIIKYESNLNVDNLAFNKRRFCMKKNVAAFFDIDGTLYRDSLLLDHFYKLIKYDIIKRDSYTSDARDNFEKWVKRKGSYEDYMLRTSDLYRTALIGVNEKDVLYTSDQLIKLNSEKVYTYTRDRLKWHLDQGHIVLFISGSPSYLVDKMAKVYNATDSIGSRYNVENEVFTGQVKPMWDRVSKTKAMDRFLDQYNIDLEKSYAYGDTNGDLFMLERVGNPIAFNPSKELLINLQESSNINPSLKIIVERKDNVFELAINKEREVILCNTKI